MNLYDYNALIREQMYGKVYIGSHQIRLIMTFPKITKYIWRMRHKILWDFDIQTDHLILTRRLNLEIINKKRGLCRSIDFTILTDHKSGLQTSRKFKMS